MTRVVNSRIRLLLLCILLVFGILLVRAGLDRHRRGVVAFTEGAAQTKATVVLPAGRGTIFDSMGTPLALGEQATTVFADPRQVLHPVKEAAAAARVLGVKKGPLYKLLTNKTLGFVYVARKADPNKAAKLAKLKLSGFGYYPEERRTYPQRSVAAQVLGYAGLDNKGLSGLELQLDGSLSGKTGEQTVIRDPFGRPIEIEPVTPARPGKAAFLTIDQKIQANAEQVLRETVAKWHAKDATAIVLDPRTGAVLAMAEAPSYDANNFPNVAASSSATMPSAISSSRARCSRS